MIQMRWWWCPLRIQEFFNELIKESDQKNYSSLCWRKNYRTAIFLIKTPHVKSADWLVARYLIREVHSVPKKWGKYGAKCKKFLKNRVLDY